MAARAWYIIIGCLLLAACQQGGPATPTEYCDAVVHTEGLQAEKTMGSVQYEARYLPSAFEALQYLGTGTTETHFNAAMAEREGIHYLELRMKPAAAAAPVEQQGLASEAEWHERDSYLSYNMARHLSLIQEGDTIDCLLAHRVASHDLSPNITFRVAFEGTPPSASTDLTLCYTDPFFNHGPLKFRFNGASIHALPTIQFSET